MADAPRSTRTRRKGRTPRAHDPFSRREIERLVARFGSPLLIIDCDRVRSQYHALRRALPRVDLHYALKPMPHPAVVRTVVGEGGYLDLATTGEVELVARLGVDPQRCIHTHPIKRDIDIRAALERGVTVMVADNPDEVRKFERYAGRVQLLLRVSFRSPGAVCDLSRKFGCDPEDLLELARLARGLGVDVCGLSFHVGSQAADPGKHVEAIESCARLIAAARREKLGSFDTLGYRRRLPDRLRAPCARDPGVLRADPRGPREAAAAHPHHRRAGTLHRRPGGHRRGLGHGPGAARGPLVVLPRRRPVRPVQRPALRPCALSRRGAGRRGRAPARGARRTHLRQYRRDRRKPHAAAARSRRPDRGPGDGVPIPGPAPRNSTFPRATVVSVNFTPGTREP
ncbi:MAG: hypothetical protein U1F11_09620 [Steroidobacteraceae bacterium]